MAKINIPTLEAKSILVEPTFDVEYIRTEVPGMIDFPDDFEIDIVKVKMNGFDVTHILNSDQLGEIQTNIEELESNKIVEPYTQEL
jgi:hypothetical protein